VHSACDDCFTSSTEQTAGGAGVGEASWVQFMMGVVTVRGEAEMAHMEYSVWYSAAVMVPSLPLAWAACS
jgi:hypothetical protein